MNARLALLFLAQALATGATTASVALGSLIAAQLGPASLAGLPQTISLTFAALAAAAFAALMLRAGRRVGLIGAYLTGAAGSTVGFAGAITGSLPLFLLGCAVVGGAQGGFQMGRYAAAESVPAHQRATAVGLLMFASVLGSAAAALLAIPLAGHAARLNVHPEAMGWLLAAGFLIGSALLTLAWRPAHTAPAPKPTAATGTPTAVPVAALALCSAQAVMITLMTLTPLRAHHLGHSHAEVAGLLSIHVAGMFGLAWLTGPLVARLGERFGLTAGSALMVTAAGLSVLSGPLALGASLFLLGLGWNLAHVAGTSIMTAHRAAQGKVESAMYLSAATGALGGSVLAGTLGFTYLAAVAGAIALLPLIAAWMHGRTRSGITGTATLP